MNGAGTRKNISGEALQRWEAQKQIRHANHSSIAVANKYAMAAAPNISGEEIGPMPLR
jgi:hypothetical protein